MVEYLAQTRSYAKAIFDLALSQKALDEWLKILKFLAQVVLACKKGSDVLDNPNIQESQKVAIFTEVIDEFPRVLNLIQLLIQRRNLSLLPSIAANYEQLFFSYTKVLEAQVVSAEELSVQQKESLFNALKKRYQREILLQYQVNGGLIGGAVIHIAGHVIDGSIKGMLQRLKQELLLKNTYAKA